MVLTTFIKTKVIGLHVGKMTKKSKAMKKEEEDGNEAEEEEKR